MEGTGTRVIVPLYKDRRQVLHAVPCWADGQLIGGFLQEDG